MATVLAFDTSQSWCTVVIAQDSDILFQDSLHMPRGHSEALMPRIQTALSKAGLSISDLDRIATLTGPGSFTGLRVGLSVAQGLSHALGIPCLGYDHFYATAHALSDKKEMAVVIDSQKADVYVQRFDSEKNALSEAFFASPEDAAAVLKESVILSGTGAERVVPHVTVAVEKTEITSLDVCRYIALSAQKDLANNFPCAAFYLKEPAINRKP